MYVAQVNRRIRSDVDGLVTAMAHLWSKFTKCLRASEGVSKPRRHPLLYKTDREKEGDRGRENTMPRHSVLLHRRYHHLAEPTTATPPIHSFPICFVAAFYPRSRQGWRSGQSKRSSAFRDRWHENYYRSCQSRFGHIIYLHVHMAAEFLFVTARNELSASKCFARVHGEKATCI